MNNNIELLKYIEQNSKMGVETIKQLDSIINDSEFKKHLKAQLTGYNDINEDVKNKLSENGGDTKDIGNMVKLSTHMSIAMQTKKDKTPSHIASMMIKGSTMGIIDITKNLKEYRNADSDVLKLGNQLLKFEQRNIEQLKTFL